MGTDSPVLAGLADTRTHQHIQPTLDTGTQALTVAVLAWLAKPATPFSAGVATR